MKIRLSLFVRPAFDSRYTQPLFAIRTLALFLAALFALAGGLCAAQPLKVSTASTVTSATRAAVRPANQSAFSIQIFADFHGRHREQNASLFLTKDRLWLEDARAPHKTLVEAGSERAGSSSNILLKGDLFGSKFLVRAKQNQILELQGDRSNEAAFLTLHTLAFAGIHAFMEIKDGQGRTAGVTHKNGFTILYQPGLGKGARMVIRKGADRVEVRIAEYGKRFVPSRLARPAA
jgi:hypothetical protein